tara:strand:- start:9066 stop:11021 length:1956 start_codon:yes stop_codon:yes gene_type:complete
MKKQRYKFFQYINHSRFSLIFIMLVTSLIIFSCTRTFLMFISVENTELSLPALFHIYSIGATYDMAFFFYAIIPFSIYLLIVPNRLWHSKINQYFIHVICYATVYALLFLLIAEIIFWIEFQVRFNFISVDYLIYRREVTDNIMESYPVIKILALILFITSIIYWKLKNYIKQSFNTKESFINRMIIATALCLVSVFSFLIITPDLMKFSNNNFQNELAGNGPYQFFSAFRNNELDYYQFYNTVDNEVASTELKNEVKENDSEFVNNKLFDINRTISPDVATEKQYNVMMVMIESLSADFLSAFGNEKNLTPNLDELASQSLMFTKFYATGTRTTRGLEAVTLSIPPTPGRSIVKRLGREKNMWSLGNVLKSKGYDTKFLYGGRGYFENMNEFFSGNGYSIIDQSTVPDEEVGFKNAWGMADEYLYTQAINSADTAFRKETPFFYHIMTTSNHRPYTYPDNRIDIPSPGGRDGAVKYTDWAIGDFIARSKDKPWFDNTIFVFVADHTVGGAGKTDLPINRYHIPLIIYNPTHIQAERIDKISSQIDLAPTLLSILNKNYYSKAFGKNIFTMKKDEERAFIANYQHLGFYTEGIMSILSPKEKLSQKIDPENLNSIVTESDINNPHMLKTLSFYQGASYIYKHKLNEWKHNL